MKKKPPPPARKPHRKKTFSDKTLTAATMVAGGMKQKDVAAHLGVTQQAVSKATISIRTSLNLMEDVIEARRHSLDRLDDLRRRSLRIAGIFDREDPDARMPPAKPQATADRSVTPQQWEEYAQTCQDQGFDVNGDPVSFAEPAQMVSAIRVMIQIEQRRAKLLGLDAPKVVATVTGKGLSSMTEEEMIREMREFGIEPPPGLEEMLRAKAQDPRAPTPAAVVGPEALARGIRPLVGGPGQ